MSDPQRTVLLVTHGGRVEAVEHARHVAAALTAAGIVVRAHVEEIAETGPLPVVPVDEDATASLGCELVVVLGGDGTILRGAELARPHDVPLLGVNLGHVGFLAEAEVDEVESVVDSIVERAWTVEERMALRVTARQGRRKVAETWAINEATVEKSARERMLELVLEVDGRPLSRWGGDGVIVATPTGSTAYAFSAGGPVVWPEVEAVLVVPLSAHALFARPLVVSPASTVAVEIPADNRTAVLWCDGRRTAPLPPGTRVEIRRDPRPLRLARLHAAPFTDRLVAKFDLPVAGWRGAAARRRSRP
ncbi:MAG TPA: NAD kinase [Candidatus Nanopelagicales bacterium]|jgi:NAD+ kinase|nr:NAD kinase [Candidatus Nanopelagicales bacterium]